MPRTRWRVLAATALLGVVAQIASGFVAALSDVRLAYPVLYVGFGLVAAPCAVLVGWTWPWRYWEVTMRFPGRDELMPGGVGLHYSEKAARREAEKLTAQLHDELRQGGNVGPWPEFVVREIFKRERFELEP